MPESAEIRALEAVYRKHFGRFVRVAAAIAGDEGRGADAVQEAFVNVLKGRANYRGEAPLDAWVWRVVVNAALAARTSRDELTGDGELEVHTNGIPVDEFGVRRWIAALPERQRLVVFLRYFADLDYRGIALALNIAVGTVSATLSAAHEALRRSLQEVER